MKYFLILFFVSTLLTRCVAPQPKEAIFDYFNEEDYEISEMKKDSLDMVYYEKYINRKDTSRKLVKSYWENGEIQSSIFLKNKSKEGPASIYDTTGVLEVEFFYIGDKKNGLSTYYDKGKVSMYVLHYQGKELPLSDEAKKEMFNGTGN